MTTKRISLILVCGAVMLMVCSLPAGDNTVEKAEQTKPVIVGTFDSRAVVIAFTRTKWFEEQHDKVRADLQKAEAAGDTAKSEEIKKWKIERQKQMHLQGFGTGDVSEYLEYIKDEIPKLAQQAGVDVVVSKWDITYHGASVKFVDVTEVIIRPFEPSEETLKGIRSMRNVAPIPAEDLEKMDHKHD
jgi:hypothetical protein